MKTIISVIAGIGMLFFITFTSTASGLELNKVSVSQERAEGEPGETILRLNGDAGWDWLHLGLTGKFFLVPIEDKYSSCNVKFTFPEFCKKLVFKAGYDWDDKYKIYNGKINYSFSLLKTIRMEIGYQNEERNPELDTGCPYRLNNESIALTWRQKPWEYSFNLKRNDKDYYEDAQYTSLKYQLGEALTWHPQTNMQLQIGYEESTGDYKTSGYKDYWKEEWIAEGKYQSKAKWRYEFKYQKLFWERGYEPYRSSYKLQLKMGRNINPTAKLTFSTSYQDLNYYSASQDYGEPGIYYKVERDLKSRIESRTGMELQFDYSELTWKIGPFWGHTEYDSSLVKEIDRLGIYAIVTWSYRNLELSLKMAPRGDLSTQDDYYQMEIVYKPREKEAINN